jgi:hypothetical protein
MKMAVFWVVVPGTYRYFISAYCRHDEDDALYGAVSQKTVIPTAYLYLQ